MSELPSILGPLLALFAALGLAAAAGLHTTAPFLILGVAALVGAVGLPAEAVPLGTPPGLALAAVTVLLSSALVVHHGFQARPGWGCPVAGMAGGFVAFVYLSSVVEGAWLIGGVLGAIVVAVLVRLTATRARIAQGERAPGGPSVRPALGELFSGLLVSVVALYSSVTVPLLVVALVAGAIRIGRGAPPETVGVEPA